MSPFPSNSFNEYCWIIGEPDIGLGTWIGPFTIIDASGGLKIGSGCDIASGVQIYTHSSAKRCVSGRNYNQVDRKPVLIGNNVFIGANSVINMGVTIGDSSVVASGSIVTKDVPPMTVVGGTPAKVISKVDLNDPANPKFIK